MKHIWLQIFKKRGRKNIPSPGVEQVRNANATAGIRFEMVDISKPPSLGIQDPKSAKERTKFPGFGPCTTESPVTPVENSPGNWGRQKIVRSIQDLPNEVLFEVLKWLDDRDLGVMQEVCLRLYAIVDELIGRKVTTSTWMTINPNNPELTMIKMGLHLISFIGVKSFKLEPVNTEYLLDPPSFPVPSFKRPYLLKSLTVHGSLHPDLFSSLTGSLIHLTFFEITLPALAQARHQSLVRLNFPCLKELKVQQSLRTCLFSNLNYNREHNETVALPNLRTLLTENRFPLLARLTFEAFDDFYTIRDLIRFIHAHPTLEELTVEMLFHPEYEGQEPTTYEEDLRATISEIRERDYCPSLKRMKFFDWGQNIYSPQLQLWNEFAMKTSTLRSLYLDSNFLPNDVLSTLCGRNGSTMEEFKVYQTKLVPSFAGQLQIDCSDLSPLQCVHKLKLRLLGAGTLTGTQHLPSTLTTVFLSALMTSNDVEHVLLHLPNLRALHLCLGLNYDLEDGEEEYGVSLDALRRFVQNREVDHLRLEVNHIDRIPLPTEGIPNGDPVNPNMLTKIWEQEHQWSYLMWDLNDDDYYVNGSYFYLPGF